LIILIAHNCPPNDCLLNCPLKNIVQILDDKKLNIFLSTIFF
jgi:hypothetical protein